jgi:hypothetical protein
MIIKIFKKFTPHNVAVVEVELVYVDNSLVVE